MHCHVSILLDRIAFFRDFERDFAWFAGLDPEIFLRRDSKRGILILCL
jgi:hypothetical protein